VKKSCEQKETIDRLGSVDVLVNVVGGTSSAPGGVLALSDDDWQQNLNVNLLSAVRLDRGLLPSMLEQGSGVIIHVSSIQRRMPLEGSRSAVPVAPKKSPNSSPSWCRIELRLLPAVSTSSMEEPSQPSDASTTQSCTYVNNQPENEEGNTMTTLWLSSSRNWIVSRRLTAQSFSDGRARPSLD
jgi:hypothetical protein